MPNLFTKRNLIIAVIVLLLIAGGVIWYLLRQGAPRGEGGGLGEFFSNLFPGGGERELTEEEQRRLEEAEREGLLPPATPAERGESFQVVREIVSGATIVKNKIRYIEKSSGHVFEIDLEGGNKQRISNTTIPGIFEVVWSPTGNRAILKYLSGENLNIISAQFVGSSTQGIFLPADIKDIAFSPKGDRILYVIPAGGENLIVTATPENKNQTVRFRSSFSSWKIYWPASQRGEPEENNIYLANAPSAYLDGFLYRLSLGTGAFQKILGPEPGLQIFPAGEKIIHLADLNLQTFPEKCAWSKKSKDIIFCGVPLPFPEGIYPDDWYKGKVLFSDAFVKLNAATLESSAILPPESVDAINPFLSEDESLLFFLNKADGTLWRVKLE